MSATIFCLIYLRVCSCVLVSKLCDSFKKIISFLVFLCSYKLWVYLCGKNSKLSWITYIVLWWIIGFKLWACVPVVDKCNSSLYNLSNNVVLCSCFKIVLLLQKYIFYFSVPAFLQIISASLQEDFHFLWITDLKQWSCGPVANESNYFVFSTLRCGPMFLFQNSLFPSKI